MAGNNYYRLPILDGVELLDAKDHMASFPFHTHNTFNITLVLSQLFTTKLNDRTLHAPPGTIMITNPGEVHSTICDKVSGNTFFTFYIPPPVLARLNQGSEVFFDNKVIDDPGLFHTLYTVSRAFEEPGVEQQLLAAVGELVNRHGRTEVFTASTTQLFREFLAEDLSKKFSLETTAGKFGLDKYKFLRLFKQQTGLTPNNFIILKRVEKSKELLQSTGNLLDVAIEAGFYDATHFCKHFKRITGITPLAYKNA